MDTMTPPAQVPVFRVNTYYSGDRIITVSVGSVQVAVAVEHPRHGDYHGGPAGGSFWHVVDGGARQTPLEARDEATARQWLEFLAGLYMGAAVTA
jgi:hypothetical protein